METSNSSSPVVDAWMLDCDVCHVWFHGPCVGIDTVEFVPKDENGNTTWKCERCILRDEVTFTQLKKITSV
jgi:Zn-finger protein